MMLYLYYGKLCVYKLLLYKGLMEINIYKKLIWIKVGSDQTDGCCKAIIESE